MRLIEPAMTTRSAHKPHPRPEILAIDPYVPGKSRVEGLDKVHKLSSNESPLENVLHEEVRARVEEELKQLQEPYKTTVILRDIEEMSYEQIAEVMNVSLGTVKSRLVRGRDALRKRLERSARELGRNTSGPNQAIGPTRLQEVTERLRYNHEVFRSEAPLFDIHGFIHERQADARGFGTS